MRAVCCLFTNSYRYILQNLFQQLLQGLQAGGCLFAAAQLGAVAAHCLAPEKHPSVRPDTLYAD
jgi:hypothetical protein